MRARVTRKRVSATEISVQLQGFGDDKSTGQICIRIPQRVIKAYAALAKRDGVHASAIMRAVLTAAVTRTEDL